MDNSQQEGDKMLTVEEVSKIIGLSRQTIHKLRKRGLIQGTRTGVRAIRFSQSSIDAYMESRKEAPYTPNTYKSKEIIDEESED